MAAATRRRVNPSANARANAAAARRRNPRLRSPSLLPPPHSPTPGLQGGVNPEHADETPAALALRQRIKAARHANIERELELELQRVEAQGATLETQASGSDPAPGGITSQTSGTIPPGPDPRIQAMIARYPFIDTIQLVNIFKNEFQAVNIFKEFDVLQFIAA
jgi:hypothetical protein